MTEKNKPAAKDAAPPVQPEAPAPQQDGPKVTWDDSKMRSSYANVCNVLGTREEIMLLFGTNQAWHGGQKQVTIALSERIVLNPYAAKRLQQLLEKGLKEYESRYGEIKP
jgi:hypothetical protein